MPPRFTFAVADVQYLVTFGVMLIVALVIANLMASVRQQTRVAGARERRTALLYAMSRELAATRGVASMARSPFGTWRKCSSAEAVVLLPDANGKLQLSARGAARRLVRRGATCRSRNGWSITASARDSAPTRCRRRRRCIAAE